MGTCLVPTHPFALIAVREWQRLCRRPFKGPSAHSRASAEVTECAITLRTATKRPSAFHRPPGCNWSESCQWSVVLQHLRRIHEASHHRQQHNRSAERKIHWAPVRRDSKGSDVMALSSGPALNHPLTTPLPWPHIGRRKGCVSAGRAVGDGGASPLCFEAHGGLC